MAAAAPAALGNGPFYSIDVECVVRVGGGGNCTSPRRLRSARLTARARAGDGHGPQRARGGADIAHQPGAPRCWDQQPQTQSAADDMSRAPPPADACARVL
jgi:hypothetical protein